MKASKKTPTQIVTALFASKSRQLDLWIWENIFHGKVIRKRFGKSWGYKLKDDLHGEWPNGCSLFGWGWGSLQSTMFHIPDFTRPQYAVRLLVWCIDNSDFPIELDRKRDKTGPLRVESGPLSLGLVAIAGRNPADNTIGNVVREFARRLHESKKAKK